MKTSVICSIAGAILALCASTHAAANDAPAPAPDTEKPKAVAAAKEQQPAAAATGAQTAQQNKMKRCNEDAKKKELKGDERRAFMSTCLKG